MDRVTCSGLAVECVQGDITAQPDIEVIVNAANAQLMPGGGVAGAIHRAAGSQLARACQSLAPISPGQAVMTDGYQLPNPGVIHCLGPIYGQDEPAAELLAGCYRRALQLAEDRGLASIAFPALSTGAFGYPMEAAARVAFATLRETIPQLQSVQLIRFVLFSEQDAKLHAGVMNEVLAPAAE